MSKLATLVITLLAMAKDHSTADPMTISASAIQKHYKLALEDALAMIMEDAETYHLIMCRPERFKELIRNNRIYDLEEVPP